MYSDVLSHSFSQIFRNQGADLKSAYFTQIMIFSSYNSFSTKRCHLMTFSWWLESERKKFRASVYQIIMNYVRQNKIILVWVLKRSILRTILLDMVHTAKYFLWICVCFFTYTNEKKTQWFSRVLKYPKKCLEDLTGFFMPTWWGDSKNTKEIEFSWWLLELPEK